jgi:hypothetical protein
MTEEQPSGERQREKNLDERCASTNLPSRYGKNHTKNAVVEWSGTTCCKGLGQGFHRVQQDSGNGQ